MNANELADYMDNNVEAMLMSEQKYIDEAATMLRQQQAEIEALKREIGIMNKYLKQANDMWVSAMKQIETYEKRMFG